MKIILASKSPRRREILETMGVEFETDVADVDESVSGELSPVEAVCEISKRKAKKVAERHTDDEIVISADTVVVIDGKIIGKPKDKEDAFNIIKSLSGRTHEVYTGFTVCGKGRTKTDFEVTKVHFKELCDDDIRRYVATGEPMDKASGRIWNTEEMIKAGWMDESGKWKTDNGNPPECMDKAGGCIWNTEKLRYCWEGKAGGYGIQDPFGMKVVRRIEGDYYNVMGLPVSALCRVLKEYFGIDI